MQLYSMFIKLLPINVAVEQYKKHYEFAKVAS